MKAFFAGIRRWLTKPRPLRIQLAVITSVTVLVGLLSILLLNSRFSYTLYENRQKRLLADSGREIAALTATNEEQPAEKLNAIESKSNVEIEIYNANGVLIYDTMVNRFAAEWLDSSNTEGFRSLLGKSRRVTVKALAQDKYGVFEIQRDLSRDMEYLTYTTRLEDGGAVRVSSLLDFIDNTANATTRQVSLIAGATFLLIIVALYLFMRRFTDPIREMNRVTRDMANMDFSQKCTAKTNNELSELSENINTLSASLDRTLRDLKEKNERLEADIEHERQLENMRKAFVSNASHELKTPIAIIHGYAEGLKLGVSHNASSNSEYCDVIMEETRKMNQLVNSMLELSKYEAGAYRLEQQAFDLREFVTESIGSYEILAQENGVRLSAEIPPQLTAYGDPEKLATVLHNFVSNALSHAEGEKRVEITAEAKENRYRVTVFNTGQPIAEEELENIWQSFYRADKAHSRAQGRYGLGLSISKAILDLHKAPYGVENRDNGVAFYFEIEKAPETNE